MRTLLTSLFLVGVSPYQDRFDEANAAYLRGDFDEAARVYEQLIAASITEPAVFFNLGNAYYRQGKLGLAIANYERVLQRDPGYAPAAQNLDKALRQTQHQLERPLPPAWEQSLLFWHYGLAYRTSRVLAILFWLLFWSWLLARLFKRLPYWRLGAAVLLLLAVALGVSTFMKAHPPQLAVATADKVPVRYGASENETVRLELAEGDRVSVEKEQAGWLRIATVGGERGWAAADDFVLVGPPYRSSTVADVEPEEPTTQ